MRIAVTGAAGTIGRRLCAELARDHAVVAIDVAGAKGIVDVRDLAALRAAFAGCDAAIHLAGDPRVDAPWPAVYDVNVLGTYNAFEAARLAGVRCVVFASSNHAVGEIERERGPALYAPGANVVVRTDAEPRPDSLYGVAKIFGEALGRHYADRFGMRVACVRIGSMNDADDPHDPASLAASGWLGLAPAELRARYAATWFSHADLARLVRAILASDRGFAIVYGVGDNATRFWDLEAGRAAYGFSPHDGVR